MYRELTNEATEYFTSCKNLYDQLTRSKENSEADSFFRVKEESLKGFCYACGVAIDEKRNLTLQFQSAIRNNYSVNTFLLVVEYFGSPTSSLKT